MVMRQSRRTTGTDKGFDRSQGEDQESDRAGATNYYGDEEVGSLVGQENEILRILFSE